MNNFYVYSLTNSLDNKVFYIGKGSFKNRLRIIDHLKLSEKGSELYTHRKIRKILKCNGEIIFNIIHETENEADALKYEINLIKEYGKENLTNLTNGGEGITGYKSKRKKGFVQWNKGKKMPKEFGENVSKKLKGRKLSESHRQKMVIHLQNISKRPDVIEKKIKSVIIPVLCVETGEIFESVKSASIVYNINYRSILRSTKSHYRAGGFRWKRLKDGISKRKLTDCEKEQKSLDSSKVPVKCIETNMVYASTPRAAKSIGASTSALQYAIREKTRCRGLHWEKISKEEYHRLSLKQLNS